MLVCNDFRLKIIVKKIAPKGVGKLEQNNVLQKTKDRRNNEIKSIFENSNHETATEDLCNKIKISIISVTEGELKLDQGSEKARIDDRRYPGTNEDNTEI